MGWQITVQKMLFEIRDKKFYKACRSQPSLEKAETLFTEFDSVCSIIITTKEIFPRCVLRNKTIYFT